MSDLTLHQVAPSPNSIKVRLALGLKGIPHERVDVGPDRSSVTALSGQPLAPVLQHGERVVYDSYAILRYLDANWPTEPRLFSPDREAMQTIEGWELFARLELGEAIGVVFGQSLAPGVDAAEVERANRLLAERVGRIEGRLAEGPALVGEAFTAADLTCAPFVSYGLLERGAEEGIRGFFAEHLRLPEGYPRTREWCARLLGYDPAA